MPIIELNNRLVDTDEIERERWKLREESIAAMKDLSDDDPDDEASKWIDEDCPEWTEEMFRDALTFEQMPPFLQEIVLESIEKKRGRPFSKAKKVSVTIRYSEKVINAFKATGKGWQSRMNAALEDYIATHDLAKNP